MHWRDGWKLLQLGHWLSYLGILVLALLSAYKLYGLVIKVDDD